MKKDVCRSNDRMDSRGEKIIPTIIKWEDGRKFAVDRILDVRPTASLKVGGSGIRYTIRVRGKETFLFREQYRWFVEAL